MQEMVTSLGVQVSPCTPDHHSVGGQPDLHDFCLSVFFSVACLPGLAIVLGETLPGLIDTHTGFHKLTVLPRKVDKRPPEKGNPISHGARPVD